MLARDHDEMYKSHIETVINIAAARQEVALGLETWPGHIKTFVVWNSCGSKVQQNGLVLLKKVE